MDVLGGEENGPKQTQGRIAVHGGATTGVTADSNELDKVKTLMSKSGNGSNSSWSEVGGASACAGIPPENVDGGGHGRRDFQTPRSSQKTEKGKRDVRFTPNGTPSLTERPLVVLGQSHVMFHNHHLSDHAFLLSTVLHV